MNQIVCEECGDRYAWDGFKALPFNNAVRVDDERCLEIRSCSCGSPLHVLVSRNGEPRNESDENAKT